MEKIAAILLLRKIRLQRCFLTICDLIVDRALVYLVPKSRLNVPDPFVPNKRFLLFP